MNIASSPRRALTSHSATRQPHETCARRDELTETGAAAAAAVHHQSPERAGHTSKMTVASVAAKTERAPRREAYSPRFPLDPASPAARPTSECPSVSEWRAERDVATEMRVPRARPALASDNNSDNNNSGLQAVHRRPGVGGGPQPRPLFVLLESTNVTIFGLKSVLMVCVWSALFTSRRSPETDSAGDDERTPSVSHVMPHHAR